MMRKKRGEAGMHRILCSTGALIGRPNGRDFRLLSCCAERLKCDGFEFMMYDSWYERLEELSRFLLPLSLNIPVMHCEKHIGEALSAGTEEKRREAEAHFEVNCQLACALGAKTMVMHLWDGLPSDRMIHHNVAAYPALREKALAHGIDLTVENVVCAQLDPLTHWRTLLEKAPQAHFTYDTKMAAFHGQTEEMYAPENSFLWTEGHIVHLHVNDYAGGYKEWEKLRTLHIGEGQIDFQRLFAYLKRVAYAGDYTVEATSFLPDGIIRFQALNRTFDRIRALTA